MRTGIWGVNFSSWKKKTERRIDLKEEEEEEEGEEEEGQDGVEEKEEE